MRRVWDYFLIWVDKIVERLPLPEWIEFGFGEAAVAARKRLNRG